MLAQAKTIIREAEVIFFGKTNIELPGLLSSFLVSFYYIFIGMGRTFYPVKKFLKVLLILLVTSFFIIYAFDLNSQNKQFLFFFSIFIPIVIVVFARPYTYCFELVKPNQINELADIIQSNGIKKEYELNILKESIELAEVRVEKRSKFFFWFLATYTGVCIFFFDFVTKIFLNIGKFNFQSYINALTLPVILYFLLTPILFLSILSYKKANDAVFQLIKLSIFEVRHRILKQSENSNKRKKRQ